MWVAILWAIWNHRNMVIFRQRKVNVEEIFCMVQLNAWLWIKHKRINVAFSYSDWYQCPVRCLNFL